MINAEVRDGSGYKSEHKLENTTKANCSSCGRNLGHSIETSRPGREFSHIYICPCGGDSFTIRTKSASYFLSADSLAISDTDFKNGDYIYTMIEVDGTKYS